jgi:hypothetical protein
MFPPAIYFRLCLLHGPVAANQAGRSISFVSAKEFKKIEGEDAEVIPWM